jgi:hypothetical protein
MELSFGGIRNPRSFEPTGVFNISTFDAQRTANQIGNAVGAGSIDNIKMNQAASFEDLHVTPANKTNGAVTDYEVAFKPPVPLSDGDMFTLIFPPFNEIETPREPTCRVVACLSSLYCTS